MKNKIYIASLLSLLSISSNAQWTSDTLQNTLVRDSSGTEEVTPLSATLSDGSTYISWFEQINGAYDMRMQLLDPDGNKLWAPEGLIVSSFPQATYVARYDLKVDHSDHAVLAFQDIRNGGAFNVVAYLFDRNGNFLWGPNGILLGDDHAEEGISPKIGVTESNNIIIGWNADSSSRKWVNYQKISQAGNLSWGSTPKRIIDSTFVAKYSRPSIVPSGSDDFVMLFVQETGSFPYTNTLFAQQFDVNGNEVWASHTQVSTKTTSFFFFPEAVSDEADGFYVGFNTSNPINASLNDVYVQHVDALGGIWSATGTEASNLTTDHKTCEGLDFISSRSEIWVLMKEQDSGQGMSGVYVQKLDLNGNVLLNPAGVIVLPISADYYSPSDFESSGDGMIILLNTGSSAPQLTKAIKIDYTGASVWPTGMIAVSSVSSGKLNSGLGTFSNNQVVAVWEDERIDRGVYAQDISSDGRLGVLTGISQVHPDFDFEIYPNPSASNPYLKMNGLKGKEISIRITDLLGKVYAELFLNESASDPSLDNKLFLPKEMQVGIYFVEMKSKDFGLVKIWVKE